MTIGRRHSSGSKTDIWLTPPYVLEALGSFDLDPCAAREQPEWAAPKGYTVFDNGLKKDWFGRVWLNPPYGDNVGVWLARLAHHGNGIALVFARTETEAFFEHVWEKADALLFLLGRLHFHFPNGRRSPTNASAPSVLVAYGGNNAATLHNCELPGQYVAL